MEALEELKVIIAGKPEGATHISDNGVFYKLDGYTPLTWWVRGKEWIDSGVHHITRSLSDIERIIELEEKLKSFADDISDCNCIGGVSKTLMEYGL